MQAHGSVVGRDAVFGREAADGGLPEIGLFQHLGILRLEIGEQCAHASANGASKFLLRKRRLLGVALQRASFRSPTSIVIRQGVSQQSVEPGGSALRVADAATSLQGSSKGRLEHLFCCFAIGEPSMEKIEEVAVTRDQAGHDLGVGLGSFRLFHVTRAEIADEAGEGRSAVRVLRRPLGMRLGRATHFDTDVGFCWAGEKQNEVECFAVACRVSEHGTACLLKERL
jgi:hypothetical protein